MWVMFYLNAFQVPDGGVYRNESSHCTVCKFKWSVHPKQQFSLVVTKHPGLVLLNQVLQV